MFSPYVAFAIGVWQSAVAADNLRTKAHSLAGGLRLHPPSGPPPRKIPRPAKSSPSKEGDATRRRLTKPPCRKTFQCALSTATVEIKTQKLGRIVGEFLSPNKIEKHYFSMLFKLKLGMDKYGTTAATPRDLESEDVNHLQEGLSGVLSIS